jgi:putative transposase
MVCVPQPPRRRACDRSEGSSSPREILTAHRRTPRRSLTDREVRCQAHLWLNPLIASALAHSFSARARRDLADLVLRAASERSSVAHARSRCRRGTSDRHARRLSAFLDLGLTQRELTRSLRQLAAPHVPGHPVDVAIDFHDVPYYGEAIDPQHPQFVKTQESRGTHRAYHYASLDLLFPHFRLTVSVRFLAERGNRRRAVLRALSDARRCGVRVRRLYLDREFYELATLSRLKAEGYTVITPMRLGSGQRKRWERGQRSYVTEHTHRDPRGKGEPLRLRVYVVVCYQAGKKWNKHGAQYLVYQVIGHVADAAIRDVPLHSTHALYRRRFGIETSHHLSGEARAITTSRSPAIGLLYAGVALLLQDE